MSYILRYRLVYATCSLKHKNGLIIRKQKQVVGCYLLNFSDLSGIQQHGTQVEPNAPAVVLNSGYLTSLASIIFGFS